MLTGVANSETIDTHTKTTDTHTQTQTHTILNNMHSKEKEKNLATIKKK